jgi:hypothetical protein
VDRRLFTLVEIVILAGLILAILYFGGLFDTKPAPAPAPLTTVRPFPHTVDLARARRHNPGPAGRLDCLRLRAQRQF